MTQKTERWQRRKLKRDNAKMPIALTLLARHEWPDVKHPPHVTHIWRSRYFLVQQYNEPGKPRRLSINRTSLNSDDDWSDGISWEELQNIKNQCGYILSDAVEVYPAAPDVVNVANMRHLWILDKPLDFAWRKS